jgi:hypothetical protein
MVDLKKGSLGQQSARGYAHPFVLVEDLISKDLVFYYPKEFSIGK